MNSRWKVFLALSGLALAAPTMAQTSPKLIDPGQVAQIQKQTGLAEKAIQQIAALMVDKQGRNSAQQKLASDLIYGARMWFGKEAAPGVPTLEVDIKPDMVGRVVVDIDATVTARLLQQIAQTGGTVISAYPRYHAVRALVGLGWLETLAARPEVRSIRPADRATTNTGSVNSQGDTTHAAGTSRVAYGVDGTGVKIGVLSDSIDKLALSQASGDLGTVTVLTGQAGSGAGEGTAMLEIVHDLAPGATLYFATAFNGIASFAANIEALQAAGCDIIIDDVTYFSESPFQDDTISKSVNTVTGNGALFFSSAGNSGYLGSGRESVWEGDFNDSGVDFSVSGGRGGRIHRFSAGSSGLFNQTVDSGSAFYLKWSDPLGGSSNDYDLYNVNASTGAIVAASTGTQNGTQDPIEAVGANAGRQLYVVQFSGVGRFLHLNGNRSRLSFVTSGTTYGHNATANAITVAAAPAVGPYPNLFTSASAVESFTSDGPRRIFYTPAGAAITPGNFSSTGGQLLQKPDITAADGVNTSAAFNGTGLNPFFGTSAAAPHAGAIAALVKSYAPSLTAADIKSILFNTAIDIRGAGWDSVSGRGIVMANQALASVPKPLNVAVSAITSNSATVTWTTNPASSSVVEYGLTAGYGSTASVAGNVTSHSVPLSGLSAGQTYHYRVLSTNSFGVTVASADGTFATATTAAPQIAIRSVSLTRTGSAIVATVTLKNTGGAASGMTITSAKLGTNNATTSLPITIGALASGGTTVQTLNFPLQPAGGSVIRIGGTYTGGSYSTSARVIVP